MRILCEAGLYGWIAVKKTLFRKPSTIKRLQRAEAHQDWTIEQCNELLWTEESKFEIFRSIGHSMNGEELVKELQPPVSHQP